MTLDLVVGVAVLVFMLLGAMSGFSRQVAQAVAGVAAFFGAGPAGRFLGQPVAQQLKSSLTVGVVLASVGAFIVIYFAVRLVLAAILRRLLEGKDQTQGTDRLLGALLGGVKAGGMAYLGLCAVTFLENNLVVAGKKFAIAPKDSVLVPLARKYNLLEYQQFSGTSDLAKALKVARDPKASSKLAQDPDLLALMKDPRFKALLSQKALLDNSDLKTLLGSNQVVELIQDPTMLHRLERVGAHDDD